MPLSPPDLPQGARGHRPQYFDDPALDQLHAAYLALATELAVALDRADALERILERQGQLDRSALEQFEPDAAAANERADRRAALVERLMRPFTDYREGLFGQVASTPPQSSEAEP